MHGDTYGCHIEDEWYLVNKVQMWLNILQCQESSLPALHSVNGADTVCLWIRVSGKALPR